MERRVLVVVVVWSDAGRDGMVRAKGPASVMRKPASTCSVAYIVMPKLAVTRQTSMPRNTNMILTAPWSAVVDLLKQKKPNLKKENQNLNCVSQNMKLRLQLKCRTNI